MFDDSQENVNPLEGTEDITNEEFYFEVPDQSADSSVDIRQINPNGTIDTTITTRPSRPGGTNDNTTGRPSRPSRPSNSRPTRPSRPPASSRPIRPSQSRPTNTVTKVFQDCMGGLIYVWMKNGDNFWVIPMSLNNNRVQGYRWRQDYGWYHYTVNLPDVYAASCMFNS